MSNGGGGWSSGNAGATYFVRDGGSYTSSYGIGSDGMRTAYCNHATHWYGSGPWCAANTYDATTGEFNQVGTGMNPPWTGGTKQVMIMVR